MNASSITWAHRAAVIAGNVRTVLAEKDDFTFDQLHALATTLDVPVSRLVEEEGAIGGTGTLHHISKFVTLLGLDEFEMYGAINRGELEASKIDGRTYLTGTAVGDWLGTRQ